jgi:PPM family protein phosphatase
VRVAENAGLTDAGRKRRRNEDAFVAEPPLFAVADGMGGAQAGEVASRLAASVFREFRDADELPPEERVAALVQEANRRIYERARSDTESSGMGTTMTAALVAGDRIAIGHVGDSRAYRLRAGRLEQLTDDHSLVADLVRSGRLTPAEAETHPQRSVITRALGTDPEVDVDSFTVEAEPGDVFVLCSDGLTTMIADEEIVDLIAHAKNLERAVKDLVKQANRRGGEDNVTVILFMVSGDEELEKTAVMGEDGRAGRDELEDTLAGIGAPTLARVEPPEDQPGWEGLDETPEPAPPSRKGRRWRPRVLWSLLAFVLVVLLVAVGFWGLSRAYFVGADEDGHVTVYQGLPWQLGGGVDFYRPRYVSQLMAVQLTAAERDGLFDHSLVSYDEARERVARYEREGVP